jgi:hypothetical protein
MAIANNIINTYKGGVNVAGILNEADVAILSNTSMQHKCLFEMIIYPEKFLTTAEGIALTALDTIIMKLSLYSINDIHLTGFEYQRYGGMNYIKDMVYPDTFNCTFIESGAGSVKEYFRKWQNEIATYTPSLGPLKRDYLFKDNQDDSKRTGILIPIQNDMQPSPEWIKIDGMKFKNLTGIGYDHASGENEILTAEFTCDSIRLSLGAAAF